MTLKLLFENSAIELTKYKAPQMKLYEFNYLVNKATNNYLNKVYNQYDINQLTTDDLRVLKTTAYLTPTKYQYGAANLGLGTAQSATHNGVRTSSAYLSRAYSSIQSLHGATYEAYLPHDYWHLLNCICIFHVTQDYKCWEADTYIEIPAEKLNADTWSLILTDIYNRPSPTRPYYYLHNQNTQEVLPTNPITNVNSQGISNGTDMTGIYEVTTDIIMSVTAGHVDVPFYRATLNVGGTTATVNGTPLSNNYPSGNPTEIHIYFGLDGEWYDTAAAAADPSASNSAAHLISGMSTANYTIVRLGAIDTPTTTSLSTITYRDPLATVATPSNNRGSNFPRTFKLDTNADGTPDTNVSLVEKPIASRFGNASPVRIEIRYGKDDSLFQLVELQIDYIKVPQHLKLTLQLLDLQQDTSLILEFPDYECQLILNEFVHLAMVHNNDPRTANQIQIDNTIARANSQTQPALALQAQA